MVVAPSGDSFGKPRAGATTACTFTLIILPKELLSNIRIMLLLLLTATSLPRQLTPDLNHTTKNGGG